MHRLVVFLLISTFALSSTSCHKKSPTDPNQDGFSSNMVSNSGKIQDVVLSGQFAGALGTNINASAGSVPSTPGGPTLTVGGTTIVSTIDAVASYRLSAATAFQKVFVTAPGKTGFLEFDMPSAKTDQGVTIFFAGLAAGSVTLQFQVATSGGAVGPIASLPVTAVSGPVGSLVAWATPDPIPYSGKTCTTGNPIDPNQACTYETSIFVFNQGGAAVNVTEYNITWTYGGTAGDRTFTFPTLAGTASIASLAMVPPIPVFVRCSQPTCDGAFFAPTPGKMSFKVIGTDSTGHPVSFQSQNFILSTP